MVISINVVAAILAGFLPGIALNCHAGDFQASRILAIEVNPIVRGKLRLYGMRSARMNESHVQSSSPKAIASAGASKRNNLIPSRFVAHAPKTSAERR